MAIMRRTRLHDPRARSAQTYEAALGSPATPLIQTYEAPAIAMPASRMDVALAPEMWELEHRRLYHIAKRAMDVVVSLMALVVLLPLFAVTALLIRLDSKGGVFYRQERLGKDAKPFYMMKFRSMYQRDIDIPPELLLRNESTGPLFKIKNDPRVTRVGRVIRKTSIDELPQLINVLKGEMSLVGPRPPMQREMAGYEVAQLLRLRVTPGVTGPWQVGGRSKLTFDEMVRLDLEYIEDRSLLLDCKLLALTGPTVLKGDGAY
jgi:lipopolysaccharide/colanic/teichoic acid biosynthesis glycosyltransferase